MGALGLLPPSLFWLAAVALLISAAMQAMTNGPIMAILQAKVAPDMQGRVFSLITALATAITPLGLLIAGPFTDAFGPRVWYVGTGILGLLIGLAGFFMPALMHIEDHIAQPAQAVALPSQAPVVPGES
jgi:DHA3 family macrolide efflux protein-like MFS transporter